VGWMIDDEVNEPDMPGGSAFAQTGTVRCEIGRKKVFTIGPFDLEATLT
jgi:hypothetical protein